ncbi:amidophosphoribosyltransferase [Thermoanaerobacterium thermosaccharolyticum]|uniref:amidophosphoribosyltransferase n=1 Tax=Thermoanaerobacterium thermosaccharolyticum TaxID=1517 RepID=UPI0020A5A76C|nr:amidophosphoribosyltransferase [Thermoanaerobacterium thermosaccharolyticum]MCP2239126.1 amidophosphoribosyltransferase [Thermoanaerobacterium thermosaccharolyticum]
MNETVKLKEECGVFGAFSLNNIVHHHIYYGLQALQHRGQESAGIAVLKGSYVNCIKGMGLLLEVFSKENLDELEGNVGIGHVRYSTTGNSDVCNAQPFVANFSSGYMALAHNGNLINAFELRRELEDEGRILQTTSDSEIILHLIAKYYKYGLVESLKKTMNKIKGSYALVIIMEDKLIGIRDKNGIRPLCIGKKGDDYYLSSESCALDVIGAELVRDVEPGEIVIIDKNGLNTVKVDSDAAKMPCVFEYIYFSRPDSVLEGISVYKARYEMGKRLAIESHVNADLVVPVPDSGVPASRGYSIQSGIPIGEGLIKNKYIGRTFICPKQTDREIGVRVKLNVLKELVRDKRIVLIDDSIVRGTTMKRLVSLLKKGGAKEVHVRISSPPVKYSCYFGIDTPTEKELVGATMEVKEICDYIGADSLSFLSIEGLKESVGMSSICAACFDGKYPMEVPKEGSKYLFEKK